MSGVILVVDDDTENREVMVELLKDSGFAAHAVSSAVEALTFLQEEERRVRFLITDFQMPVISGLELIRHALKERPDLPIILITGEASDDVCKSGLEAGAMKVFIKSAPWEKVEAAIREALNERQCA